ncbi:hypothetical protein DS878_07365 [Marinobacter sp. F3R11]|nr:hypothetical protein DS878_07365 [Marinobacter sp. F3R11]
MNRDDFAWVIVRAFGVYFSAQAFLQLYWLGASTVRIAQLYEMAAMETPRTTEIESQILRSWIEISYASAEFLLFILLAYYCLRRGGFIHRILCYRAQENDT